MPTNRKYPVRHSSGIRVKYKNNPTLYMRLYMRMYREKAFARMRRNQAK
jgi:hypothetical protein